MGALGLTTADLFDEKPYEVARYQYINTAGELLFVKKRMSDKKFFIESPRGDSWKPGLNGTAERPLYRLPELLDAIRANRVVYVTEGEKDADRLWEIGVAATCNFGGAAEWRDEYAEYFWGASVIIIADRDEPGEKHAREIRNSLRGKARNVRIMQSRTTGKGDDVSDHLDFYGDLDGLVPYGRYLTVPLGNVARRGVAAPVLMCDGFLYEGGLHSMAGAPDAGKSTLCLFWVLQLLLENRSVLFMDEEGGPEIVTEKLVGLGAQPHHLENLTYVPFPGSDWSDSDIGELVALAEDVRPSLMLWDSSAAFLARAGLDENLAGPVTAWWSKVLTPIARNLGVAMLVIDHDVKSSEGSRYARGSGAKLAAIDVQFKVEIEKPFTRNENGLLRIKVTKDRRGWLHRDWRVDVETGDGRILPSFSHWEEPDAEPDTSKWPPSRRSLWTVMDGIYRTQAELIDRIVARGLINYNGEATGLRRETASRELTELARDGFADRDDNPGEAARWRRKV